MESHFVLVFCRISTLLNPPLLIACQSLSRGKGNSKYNQRFGKKEGIYPLLGREFQDNRDDHEAENLSI